MTNLDSVLKSRDIYSADKGPYSQAVVFPVVTYGCESWTVKKAKSRRIDASNCGAGEDSWQSHGQQGDQTSQSEGKYNPEYSMEGMMLNLKLEYFGHLMRRVDSLEKTWLIGVAEDSWESLGLQGVNLKSN